MRWPPCTALAPLALLGATLALGCNTTPSKPSLMANMAKDELTVYELRAMDYEYAARFAQLVAAATSDIIAASDNQSVREHALLWRVWAMPEARSAAFDQDPFAGSLELWILARQQHQYFTVGGGKDWFGKQQPRALETTLHLQEAAEQLLSTALSEAESDTVRETGRNWVEEHPIEGTLYVRPTARADLASLVPQEQLGGLKAMGSMEETLRDLSDRVTILSAQTPTEIRWQGEYLVESLFEERVQDRIDSIVGSMEGMTAFLDEFEGTLFAQTQTLLSGIEQERLAVFQAIEGERVAVLGAIENERESILEKLDSQLIAATAELDSVGKRLIDHFFARLVQVLAVVGVVVFLIVLLVLYVGRRRNVETIDRTPPSE